MDVAPHHAKDTGGTGCDINLSSVPRKELASLSRDSGNGGGDRDGDGIPMGDGDSMVSTPWGVDRYVTDTGVLAQKRG